MPRQERTKSATCIYHVMLRGIRSITYDYAHYPSYISMSIGKKIRYADNDYTPDGRKLSSKHRTYPSGNISVTTTDLYIDGLMLRNGAPLLWRFDGGYVDLNANGTPTRWNYYIADHLGSTRMVVDSNDSIRETINYYPFGSEMRMSNPAQMSGDTSHPFRFTGKELDRQNSLNMYDFGARWYDVAGVPMWTSVDPLAEKYYHITPYSYCAGNPVMLVDPDGREVIDGLGSNNKDNENLKDLVKDLLKHDDPNSIMIVAHGVCEDGEKVASSINIQTYDSKTEKWNDNYISDGKQFSKFLSRNSTVWNNYKAGKIDAEEMHIVMYACSSSEVAKRISSDSEFKDITFIAPTKDIGIDPKAGVVVSDLITKNGKTVIDNSYGKGLGNWNTIRNGRYPLINFQYPGNSNLKPGSANFKYKYTLF